MEKTFKNPDDRPIYTIGVIKNPRKKTFSWKIEPVPHWKSLHTVKFNSDKMEVYDCDSLYVPMFCQFFWLGLIFYIKVYPWKIGEGKMVRYEDSHYAEIDRILN